MLMLSLARVAGRVRMFPSSIASPRCSNFVDVAQFGTCRWGTRSGCKIGVAEFLRKGNPQEGDGCNLKTLRGYRSPAGRQLGKSCHRSRPAIPPLGDFE